MTALPATAILNTLAHTGRRALTGSCAVLCSGVLTHTLTLHNTWYIATTSFNHYKMICTGTSEAADVEVELTVMNK